MWLHEASRLCVSYASENGRRSCTTGSLPLLRAPLMKNARGGVLLRPPLDAAAMCDVRWKAAKVRSLCVCQCECVCV